MLEPQPEEFYAPRTTWRLDSNYVVVAAAALSVAIVVYSTVCFVGNLFGLWDPPWVKVAREVWDTVMWYSYGTPSQAAYIAAAAVVGLGGLGPAVAPAVEILGGPPNPNPSGPRRTPPRARAPVLIFGVVATAVRRLWA